MRSMAKEQEIGAYSAYAIAVKYGYTGTEKEWIEEQERSRKAAAQSASDASDAKAAAQAAQKFAENAKAGAESAKSAAEDSAASARLSVSKAAQSASDAESAKAAAGEAQKAAEAAKSAAAVSASLAQESAAQAASSAESANSAKTAAAQSEQRTAASEANVAQAEERISKTVSGAVEAVKAQKTKSVQAVAAQGEASVAAVTAEGERVLGTIPADYTAAVGDIDALKKSKAEIDDAAIDGDTWSSRHIVDMLCPKVEKSGTLVQMDGLVEGYPLGVTASWKPMQEGSGEPSPENIRPIHGRDSVKVERCGENLLPFGERIEDIYSQQIMASDALLLLSKAYAEQDLTLTFTTETQDLVFQDNVEEEWRKRIGFECHGTLADGTEAYVLQCWIDNRNGELTKNGKKTVTVKVTMPKLASGNVMFYAQKIKSGSFVAYDFGIYAGTIAPTTYTPYIGSTNTLTLPSTVYGGEVDAAGKGQETWGCVDSYAGETLPAEWICDRAAYAVGTTPPSGAQVAYKLANPVPFTVTGGAPIKALPGTNTVLTDADSAAVTGRADPIQTITKLSDRIAALEAAATNITE